MKLSTSSDVNYNGYPNYAFVREFERNFDHDKVHSWMKNNWHLSAYIAVAYLVLVGVLKQWMKNRDPIDVRRLIMFWDFALAAFSICGMSRCVPEVFYLITNYGLEFTICDSNANNVTLFWVWAFVFSKAVELLDTVFVILIKQKLTFLHVSHHVMTLLICWYYSVDMPFGPRWTIPLNYSVHSFMYTYFALKTIKVDIPSKISMCITLAQIVQFCIAIAGSLYAIRASFIGRPCGTSLNLALVVSVFCSFLLYLFVSFFLRRYNFIKTEKKIS